MGADIRNLRNRIKSVNSTLHLTKAMGLVASSKMRRATDAMIKGRSYAQAVQEMVALLCQSPECKKSPYLEARTGERTRLIVIAGDRGLAGGYNANVFRLTAEYPDAEIVPIGKRACERYRSPIRTVEGYSSADAAELARQLCEEFRDGAFDRLGIVRTRYVSLMSQQAEIQWIFPLEPKEPEHGAGVLFEPDELTILEAAIPEYVSGMISAAVRESFASEVAARRMAMDSAGKNAQEMIDDLQLQYNRARQSAITQEITEIVAGGGS